MYVERSALAKEKEDCGGKGGEHEQWEEEDNGSDDIRVVVDGVVHF